MTSQVTNTPRAGLRNCFCCFLLSHRLLLASTRPGSHTRRTLWPHLIRFNVTQLVLVCASIPGSELNLVALCQHAYIIGRYLMIGIPGEDRRRLLCSNPSVSFCCHRLNLFSILL